MTWLLFIVMSISPVSAGPSSYPDKAACMADAARIVAANPAATGAYVCFQPAATRAEIAAEGAVAFGPQSANTAAAEQHLVSSQAQSTASR